MKIEENHRIRMQYLIVNALPRNEMKKEFGGAVVSCWIKNQTRKNAAFIAKGWIDEAGWIAQDIEEQYEAAEDDYQDDPSGKEFFDQAMIDGEVFVFHRYPKSHDRTKA